MIDKLHDKETIFAALHIGAVDDRGNLLYVYAYSIMESDQTVTVPNFVVLCATPVYNS